jgi:hypothetical protein
VCKIATEWMCSLALKASLKWRFPFSPDKGHVGVASFFGCRVVEYADVNHMNVGSTQYYRWNIGWSRGDEVVHIGGSQEEVANQTRIPSSTSENRPDDASIDAKHSSTNYK